MPTRISRPASATELQTGTRSENRIEKNVENHLDKYAGIGDRLANAFAVFLLYFCCFISKQDPTSPALRVDEKIAIADLCNLKIQRCLLRNNGSRDRGNNLRACRYHTTALGGSRYHVAV